MFLLSYHRITNVRFREIIYVLLAPVTNIRLCNSVYITGLKITSNSQCNDSGSQLE